VDVVDNSCIYITAPIDEVDAPRVREGMPARVTLDAFRDRIFPAHVRRVAPYVLDVEKQARTVEVEVVVADPPADSPLLAGYSADVEIIIDRHEDVLRIPTAATRPGEPPTVLVLDADTGLLQAREIKLGLSNWEWTEVVSGLTSGEQVVLSLDRDGVEAGAAALAEQVSD
jgi:HlyD family secretion protein